MPGISTRLFALHNAKQFFESFGEAAPTNLYLFISKVSPWDNDTVPPAPIDTIEETDYNLWDTMLGAKRINSGDVSHSVQRYNWANSTVYRMYDSSLTTLYDTPISSNTYYIVTDEFNVYKCLFNNDGALSIDKPTGTGVSLISTTDGYIWKYMYTITSSDQLKYLTANTMPVKTLDADDGSSQWTVQSGASNGSIDIIKVASGGSGYVQTTGNVISSNSTGIVLQSNASGVDDFYNGTTVYISAGAGAGQFKNIDDYIGALRFAQVNTSFVTTVNTTSQYHVGPKITINNTKNSMGSGATAYANVSGGAISVINMIDRGSNYSSANTVISGTSGTGANGVVMISPPGGHGSNPVEELNARNVTLNILLNDSESNTITINNDYRVIGLVANPLLANGNSASLQAYNLTTKLTLSSVSAGFVADETVVGSSSSATGTIVDFANTNGASTEGVLSIINLVDEHTVGETITANNGTTAAIDSIENGAFTLYSGNILYVENRIPITRSADQLENFKITVKF